MVNAAARGNVGVRHCPLCSSAVPDTATTCPTCGAPLDAGAGDGPPADLAGVLPPGTRLDRDSYSIGRVLGRGGFGVTYLGADLHLKRTVAIKEFFPAGASRRGSSVVLPGVLGRADYELAIEKFIQEAQMVTRFRHRSIVNVYEVFQENDTAYMVMEYLQGEHLLERMERRGQPLDEADLLNIAGPVAEALDEVHAAGVLHRDIKPENIMLVGPEDAPRPVLIDFGAAREFASGMVNRHSIVLTPGYAPLEQYGEQARRGPFTDIYAFAATLYHVATGQQPPVATERALGIELKPPRALNPALSAEFERALLRGLEMKVDQRPQRASTFYFELAGVEPAATAPPAAAPVTTEAQAPVTRTVPPPPPAPTPVAPTAGTHLERVRQIAATISGTGPVATDRLVCPVCRAAALRQRFSASDLLRCPSCARGQLSPVPAAPAYPGTLMRCPSCREGMVTPYARTQMMLIPDLWGRCDTCRAEFDFHMETDSLTLAELPHGSPYLGPEWRGQTKTRTEWAALAGDPEIAYVCPVCAAELLPCGDGGLEWAAVAGDGGRVPREHRGQCRARSEWAKIAHRVPRDEGTLSCPNCNAQFDETAPGTTALLRAPSDPYGVAARYGSSRLASRDWQRIAAGGVPEAEEQRLREQAQLEFWAALLAGEVSTASAAASFPVPLAPDEKVVLTLDAVQIGSRFGFLYERDDGPLWLTTRRLLYRGRTDAVDVDLRRTTGLAVREIGPDQEPVIEISGRNGSTVFRFVMSSGPSEFIVDGLTLSIPWSAESFRQLFESLRTRR